ncbi:D-alanyl-D-alanine carboxypeptidase [Tianweitania sp. BSSL-BM11]|uniref:serine-type D-Ala-D-Ala carboxypeptidase n=1 Tax=Tianweitania aestuarii TaxID=2814886 RepID=A0ABS5RTL5_9HYPH|nr:D-alanyl-D-alanine carboxypeptidase family protein [Tianweitania aestuarii]MBS9720398.1 D-alanyl-D-alanine carboxypeptidase [Tianweitania aestuarii]
MAVLTHKHRGRLTGLSLALVLLAPTAWAQGEASKQRFETKAPQAFLMEAKTGTVLFSKQPDTLIAPAALAKLMTMEVVFDALKSGRAKLDDVYTVSENAWRTGGAPSRGSTMFAAVKSQLTLNDLIQGAIVQSANDACIIIAEGMAGSEAKFAELMNERAREIGLKKSVFKNATGLPAEGQVVSLSELAILGRHIWETYPELYRIYAQRDFTWNKITQRNRNPLLSAGIGADGMGTGYTEASGYAILGSAEQNGRRLFAAMSGMTSEAERAQEARKLLDYGLNGFEDAHLFDAGAIIGTARVYGGMKQDVPLKSLDPVEVFVPLTDKDLVKVHLVYDGPLRAPIASNQPIGSLEVWIGDSLAKSFQLAAAEDVALGSLSSRAADAAHELAFGWLR